VIQVSGCCHSLQLIEYIFTTRNPRVPKESRR
jgi:hypothetical protein